MYEIWLALNVIFELALANLPVVLFFLALWVALMGFVLLRGRANWRGALPAALLAWLLAAAAAVFGVPAMTQSSLSDMHYWVDWANLLAIAGGLGGIVALFVWPFIAGMARRA
jgi:hypothetical protein